jgi:predicted N-acetyltransferase YhbS
MTITIRKSTSDDLSQILALQHQAFGEKEGGEVATLVQDLLRDNTAKPLLSLVAVSKKQIVGYILFTTAHIDNTDKKAVVLAPLAVNPQKQRQGIGTQLILTGCGILKKLATHLVFVLGHTSYYPKFGFKPAIPLGFDAPYILEPQNQDAWMVKTLTHNAKNLSGKVKCALTMDKAKYWQE